MQTRRMRHAKVTTDHLATCHIKQAATLSLERPPAYGNIGFGQRRDIARSRQTLLARTHGQAVEMAAVSSGQGAHEPRLPARDKAVVGVQSANAREARIDNPQFIACPAQLVSGD